MIGLTAFPIIFRRSTRDKGEIQMKELDAVKLVEDYEIMTSCLLHNKEFEQKRD